MINLNILLRSEQNSHCKEPESIFIDTIDPFHVTITLPIHRTIILIRWWKLSNEIVRFLVD